ncbi:MAG TPA: hypothetical protein VFK15_15895 [Burkholderiales bacterium]|nr:hypothetical protein [Burkholderiales bacterium]
MLDEEPLLLVDPPAPVASAAFSSVAESLPSLSLSSSLKRLEIVESFLASSRDTLPSLLASSRFIDEDDEDALLPFPDDMLPLLAELPADGLELLSVPAAFAASGSAKAAAIAAAISVFELTMAIFLSIGGKVVGGRSNDVPDEAGLP